MAAVKFFRLKQIEAVSPTLAETLRICKLRAGLSRANAISQYILGNPKAWLGTAYHVVLEAVGSCHSEDVEAQIKKLWARAVQNEYSRARLHPLDKRFGPPESWPGYYVAAALVAIRAEELVKTGTCQRSWKMHNETKKTAFCESMFSGAKGKIVGRPDVVSPGEIIDYKSGDIFEDECHEQIKHSYIRQLRIYGFLVRETLGWWPKRGVLLPMIGSQVPGFDSE